VLKNDIQKLEPGSLVTLIEVDTSSFGGDVLYFHGHSIAYSEEEVADAINPLISPSLTWLVEGQGKPIFWKGLKYTAWPCQVEGIEADSTGQPTSPTLAVGNIDGTISSLCLFFDDLVQATVTIRQTLSKYLDSENFTTINPDADPTQEVVETWYIDAKTQEDNQTITWQLSNPADLSGQIIPARLISGMCQWALKGDYRGADCGYLGTAMFDENDNPVTDPADDKCGGLLSSCKLRFGESEQLSFGGMPSANLLGR